MVSVMARSLDMRFFKRSVNIFASSSGSARQRGYNLNKRSFNFTEGAPVSQNPMAASRVSSLRDRMLAQNIGISNIVRLFKADTMLMPLLLAFSGFPNEQIAFSSN